MKLFRKIRQQLAAENNSKKYLRYAFGEILLVVIGILIAIQVNNWNDARKQQIKIGQYAKSLTEDLKNDIQMLRVSQSQAIGKYKAIDSLRHYVAHTPASNLSNTILYLLIYDVMYRPYKWNRSTFNELKNSDGLRYIVNDSIQNKLVAYESFSFHLDEDFEFDKSNARKADDMLVMLLDLNTPYFVKIAEYMEENMNHPDFDLYEYEEFRLSLANDLQLLSNDQTLIKKFTNSYILIQDQYRIRAFSEMQEIIQNAEDLILLLQEEYQL